MTLERITAKLPVQVGLAMGSPDGTITFDLPHKAVIALAELGLKVMASDACVYARLSPALATDPLDILWEKLDALSKD